MHRLGLVLWSVTFGIPIAAHELGHGIAALARGSGPVCIDLGREPRGEGRRVGPFTFRVRATLLDTGGFTFAQPRSRTDLVIIVVAGPLVGLAIGIGMAVVAWINDSPLLGIYCVAFWIGPNVAQAAGTDGKIIRRLSRDKRQGRPSQIFPYQCDWQPPSRCRGCCL